MIISIDHPLPFIPVQMCITAYHTYSINLVESASPFSRGSATLVNISSSITTARTLHSALVDIFMFLYIPLACLLVYPFRLFLLV